MTGPGAEMGGEGLEELEYSGSDRGRVLTWKGGYSSGSDQCRGEM